MGHASDGEKQEIGRRMKAARAYAGLDSQQDLADKINDEGYRKDAIVTWETGNYVKPLARVKLKTVAEACGLPVQFFYMDFGALSLLDEDETQVLDWWRVRSAGTSGEEEPGSQNRGGA